MYFIKKFYCWLFLLSFIPSVVNAQLFSNRKGVGNIEDSNTRIISDTSKKKQANTNDSLSIYYTSFTDTIKRYLDTSILNQYRNPLLNIWQRDIGNLGTAYSSLKFSPNMNPELQLGMQNNQTYLFNRDSIKFYNTTRPYTDIFYNMGSKNEQLINLLHTQNVKPNWNIASGYRKIVSPGNFKFLRSNHDNGFVSSHYTSNNLQYELKGSFVYNKMQQDENGGLRDENELLNPAFRDKRLIPVLFTSSNFSNNRSSVLNYYRNVSFNITQQYFFGKSTRVYNADSSEVEYQFKPKFGLRHKLYTNDIRQYYKDQSPDSAYYGYLYNRDQANSDSLYHKHYLSQIGNAFSLNQNIGINKSVLQLEAGYGLELDKVGNLDGRNAYLNNYIFGNIIKQEKLNQPWNYNVGLKLYFTGNAKGNFLLNGNLSRKISDRLGIINIGLLQSLQSPSYKMQYYNTNHNADQTKLSKTSITKLFFNYTNPAWKLSTTLSQYTVVNYLYIDSLNKIRQYDKAISLSQLDIHKVFRWRKYVLTNHVVLQFANTQSPLHVPLLLTNHQLAYENYIFNKKLQVATGIEFRYNTPFLSDEYVPIFQFFAVQYNRTISNIPILSYFFDFKIKRYRAAISFDEIQQLYAVNNLNYPFYPSQNFMIHFRFNWVFIN